MKRYCWLVLVAVSLQSVDLRGDEPKPATSPTAAKDRATVETLLRLKGVDVNSSPNWKSAVTRHLETVKGTPRYLDIVEKLKLRGVEDELFRLAMEDPASTMGAKATTMLIKTGETARFDKAAKGDDEQLAVKAVVALGSAVDESIVKMLEPLVADSQRSSGVRIAAVNAIGKNRIGQKYLLGLAQTGNLSPELGFSAANILLTSSDEAVRSEATKYLKLPAAADKPIPPIAELIKLSGDPERGVRVFQTTGTCAKCHKVRGEGKDVGPDLTEIGSKLSKDAFFVSILDPSAGISHNYETYVAVTTSGTAWTGLLVNRTDQSVTIRTNEAVDKEIPAGEIDELQKTKTSLMPADLQKLMSVQDLVDVVSYLTTLKKAG